MSSLTPSAISATSSLVSKLTATQILLAFDENMPDDERLVVVRPSGEAYGWSGVKRVESLSRDEISFAQHFGKVHEAASGVMLQALQLAGAPALLMDFCCGGAHPLDVQQMLAASGTVTLKGHKRSAISTTGTSATCITVDGK